MSPRRRDRDTAVFASGPIHTDENMKAWLNEAIKQFGSFCWTFGGDIFQPEEDPMHFKGAVGSVDDAILSIGRALVTLRYDRNTTPDPARRHERELETIRWIRDIALVCLGEYVEPERPKKSEDEILKDIGFD